MSDADGPESEDAHDDPVRDVVRVDGEEPTDGDAEDADGPPGREGVMDPEDLDIRDRDGVDETDDGRYVITTAAARADDSESSTAPNGTDDRPVADAGISGSEEPSATGDGPAVGDDSADGGESTGGEGVDADHDDPLAAVATELDALAAPHGFALAVAAGGETDTLRVAAGDPTDTLETALRWYARRVNPGAPPEETIRSLLADSDIDLG
ncbi:hypothetical protein Hbl1158_11885 [Halobaculum sp. CBA1158]|uniref:DUF7500 family protein n=1 Tax=Halobaculum sp. CBA1158 TaxID=2904243 RepID=UPI001F393E19|nr:hypothetical protein [Halobaculum sp. CBA1158]UIO99227.1 hypothetical protein Hbl1158_11885 [Halobaculum sp. CBA1158]